MATLGQFHRVFSISRVQEHDDGTCFVEGIAATESRGDDGLVISSEAMRGAIPDFLQPDWKGDRSGPLRAMHQLIAAGKVAAAEVRDDGTTYVVAHVVDRNEALKVREGVYRAFSVRGSIPKDGRDPTDITRVVKFKLKEISLVDLPGDPGAKFTVVRAEGADEVERETMDHPGNPNHAEDGKFTTGDGGSSGGGASLATDERGKAAELASTPAEHKKGASYHAAENARHEKAGNKKAAKAHADAVEAHLHAIEKPSKANSMKAGLASDLAHQNASTAKKKIERAAGAEDPDMTTPTTPVTDPVAPPPAAGAAPEVRRGVYEVTWGMEILQGLSNLAGSCAWDAKMLGDGSTVPEKLRAALTAASEALRSLVDQALAQLLNQTQRAEKPSDELTAALGAAIQRALEIQTKLATDIAAALPEVADVSRLGRRYSKSTRSSLRRCHESIRSASKELEDLEYDLEDAEEDKAALPPADKDKLPPPPAEGDKDKLPPPAADDRQPPAEEEDEEKKKNPFAERVAKAEADVQRVSVELETTRAALTAERDAAVADVTRVSSERDAAVARAAQAEQALAEAGALLRTKGIMSTHVVDKGADTRLQRVSEEAPLPSGPDHEKRMREDPVYRRAQELEVTRRAMRPQNAKVVTR